MFQSRAVLHSTLYIAQREELVAGWPSKTGLAEPNRLPRAAAVGVHVIWRIDNGGPDCPGPFALPWVLLSRPTRTSPARHSSLRGLLPLAYPCFPSTPTTGPDGGWWTGQWAQDLQGLVLREGANVPMYPRTRVAPAPLSTRAQRYPAPCHPSFQVSLYRPLPPAPVNSHGPAHAMCGLSLAGREPDWGPRDRPPPGPGR